MWAISPATRIYLAAGATNMRLGFNGLSALVENQMRQSLLSGHLFAFCNKRRNRLKVLFWDGSGLICCSKRLYKGCFTWPGRHDSPLEYDRESFLVLLSGLELGKIQRKRWYRCG